MKTIGIILREWNATYKNRPLYAVGRDVIKYLRKYKDINLICIPINFEGENEFERVKTVVDLCNGIIFPGGDGITQIDCEIMQYLYKIDKPTLGICLGMQIMGKALEGKIQHNKLEGRHNKEDKYVHDVVIDKNSNLYKILKDEQITVNSRHFDNVVYTKLDIVATSEKDDIIEAIEDKNKTFFIGVQWHPESIFDDKYSSKLFDDFVSKL